MTLTDDPAYQAFCQERLGDPYPLYRRLRNEYPVHWCEPMSLWLVSCYEDVFAGLRDQRLSSSRMGMYAKPLADDVRARVDPLMQHLARWIILQDPPDHGRLRRLVNLAFTPRMLAGLRPRIEQLTWEFLERIEPGRRFDVISQLCYPLPATVICEMLGIPLQERDAFRRATERLMNFSTRGGPTLAAFADQANESVLELSRMFDRLIHERRRAPKEDLISALVLAEQDGDRLSHDELFAMCVFLFLAGHETTTNLMASGILALLQNPEEFQKLKAAVDALVVSAVEEMLRFESSVTRAVRRAKEDLEMGGKMIRAGQTVILLLGSANRDERQFPDPDRFDVTRQPNKHVAFGFGPHFCLGGPLARMELEIAFRAIVARLPGLRLAGEPLKWKPVMGVRALEALAVVA